MMPFYKTKQGMGFAVLFLRLGEGKTQIVPPVSLDPAGKGNPLFFKVEDSRLNILDMDRRIVQLLITKGMHPARHAAGFGPLAGLLNTKGGIARLAKNMRTPRFRL